MLLYFRHAFQIFHIALTFEIALLFICTALFNVQQLYVLLTQYISIFCVDLRTNSDYFPIQH